jgi:hypothetical protein
MNALTGKERLHDELENAAAAIDDSLLSFASPEAKTEWSDLCAHWLRSPAAAGRADGELAQVVMKVRRFGEILRQQMKPPSSS